MRDQPLRSLSKSRFLSGLQCPKRLWREIHARATMPAVDRATQALFDQGHRVGALATDLFPGGLEIGPDIRRWDRVLKDTQRALTQERPLFEAAFRWGGAACRVDILAPAGDGAWDVFEVKSTTGVKEVHYEDLSLQAYVIEGSGLPVRDYFLVHLDSSYVRDGDLDLDSLFCRARVTDEVRSRSAAVGQQLEGMEMVLGQTNCPDIAIGGHCDSPYSCPLKDDCWSFLPAVSVFDLVQGKQKGLELLTLGVENLTDIPLSFSLNVKQNIQLEAVRAGEPHIDREVLGSFLARLEYPIFYFDLETIGPAIPLFDRSRPYEQIPFLFSIHRVEGPGDEARHYSHLVSGEGDPRPEFLLAVRASLGEKGSIVAYNAPFERRILRESAATVLPELEEWVAALEERFVDLLEPFKVFAYHHPKQLGSASLKAVLNPLTGLSYADMEISGGAMASAEYLRLITNEIDAMERASILKQLEAYCSLDTLAMVAIVEELHQLVA